MECWLVAMFLLSQIYFVYSANDKLLFEKLQDKQMVGISHKNNMEHCALNRESQVQLWSRYYNCLSRKTKNQETGQIPNIIVRGYEGSVARLPCNLCVSPLEKTHVIWLYAESVKNLSFNVMEEKETAVINEELTLYHTRPEDAGVYQCKVENSFGGLVPLEVTDVENYTVVKPSSTSGPYPAPPKTINKDLVIFTSWTPWSECSICDAVGRRRRYGICYVALTEYKISNKTAQQNCTPKERIDDDVLNLFHAYPKGIPCRSQMLPPCLRSLPDVQSRSNEIMIGLCKVPCKNGIFEMRSDTGKILERVDNTAGIFSLCQIKPLQPPPTARETMFVLPGAKISIGCPGTTGRDIPVSWRIGNKLVAPRLLDASTGGRMHLNSRDRIVFSPVEYDDADVYSCWQGDILAGVIKLEVSKSAGETYRNRFIFVAFIIFIILLINYTRNLLRHILRGSKPRVQV